MSFRPVHLTARQGRSAVADILRYRVRSAGQTLRLCIMVPAPLYKGLSPEPKGWRLDVDPEARRARLTTLVQMDVGPAVKKHVPRDDEQSLVLAWPWAQELREIFPDGGKVVLLHGHVVTKMGIEFPLPEPATAKA